MERETPWASGCLDSDNNQLIWKVLLFRKWLPHFSMTVKAPNTLLNQNCWVHFTDEENETQRQYVNY